MRFGNRHFEVAPKYNFAVLSEADIHRPHLKVKDKTMSKFGRIEH